MNIKNLFTRNILFFLYRNKFKESDIKGLRFNNFTKVKSIKKFKKIIFLLNNPKIIHLGDQLFFFSIAKSLSNNFEIEIIIDHKDDIIFKDFFKISNSFEKNDLLISSIRFFCNQYQKYENYNLLSIDYNDFSNNQNLLGYLQYSLLRNNIIHKPYHLNNKDLNVLKSDSLKVDYYYFILNDEIFSSLPINYENKRKRLISSAFQIKNKFNAQIIRSGLHIKKYPTGLIDADMTSSMKKKDIIRYISNPKCLGVITFDNFFMHSASLFNKLIFVMPRGRILKKNSLKILNQTVPFFNSKSEITLLDKDYINHSDKLINQYKYL
jgi:hypothetical protein